MAEGKLSVGILTVSDTCARSQAEDRSGPNLKRLVERDARLNASVVATDCAADDRDEICTLLRAWADGLGLDVILTTGGTGVSPRDITPEATRQVIEKEVPGLSMNMIMKSLAVTHMAMLSRPVCGIRGKTLIINLPGSSKGSQECYEFISPCLRHACDLLSNRSGSVAKTHADVQKMTSQHGHADTNVDNQHVVSDVTNIAQHDHHVCPHRQPALNDDVIKVPSDDVTNVSRRPRESPYPMISMEEADRIVMDTAITTTKTESVHFNDALGRVLSRDVTCAAPFPPFPASVKDGYAVLSEDGAGLHDVIQASTAGGTARLLALQTGQCTRISTGAPVPRGADAVVQVEDTELVTEKDGEEVQIRILKPPSKGLDIRPIGSDIPKNSIILSKHTVLGAAELSLLATVGSVFVECFRRPKVGILSTGDELVQPDLPLAEGKIRDSNKTALMFTLKEQGIEAVDLGIVRDEADALYHRLAGADVDVLITTGGVSMGEKDLIKPMLQKLGAKIHFGRILMKPGKPTTFASKDGQLFFCLPGNPVSAMVTCHLFVIPAVRKMCGHPRPENTVIKAEAQNVMRLDPRPEYHRVTLDWLAPIPRATSTGNQSSCRLVSMKSATALLRLPCWSPDRPNVNPGDMLDAVLIDRHFS